MKGLMEGVGNLGKLKHLGLNFSKNLLGDSPENMKFLVSGLKKLKKLNGLDLNLDLNFEKKEGKLNVKCIENCIRSMKGLKNL